MDHFFSMRSEESRVNIKVKNIDLNQEQDRYVIHD